MRNNTHHRKTTLNKDLQFFVAFSYTFFLKEQFTNSLVSTTNTQIEGEGIERTMSNFNNYFLIHIRDKYNHCCILPLSAIKVEIKPFVDQNVQEQVDEEIKTKISYVKDSTVKVEYNIYLLGDYQVNILLNGKKLDKSPFILKCDPISLKYQSDFDKNGFFYFISTKERKQDWKNPLDDRLITVTPSSSKFGKINSIFEMRNVEFYTDDIKGSFVIINIEGSGFKLCPNAYTIKHGYNFGSFMLKNWNLEGSMDGTTWKLIKEHKEDMSLASKGYSTYTWPIDETDSFLYFRIVTTGVNQNGSNHLMLGGIEFYGTLTRFKKLSMTL